MDIQEMVKLVEEGQSSPLKTIAEFKLLVKELTDAIAQIEDYAFREAETYGEKTFKDFGYSFEVREGGRRYDFSKIEEWKAMTKAIKDREAIYMVAASAYEKGGQIFDDETGEQVPIPIVKYNKQALVIRKI